MPDHVASVKIKIESSAAKSGIRDIENETKRAAGSMKAALGDAVSAGLKGAKGAAKDLLGDIKSAVSMAGSVLGGIGVAELTKGALEANSKFGDLAAGIKFAGGSAKDAAAAQKQAQQSAVAWAQDSLKVADAFTAIKDETGSIDFAQASIDTVSEAARGAHKSLESMGDVAGTLNKKFGITASELPQALADVVSLSTKGGPKFEELAERMGLIGAYAKEAGLQGREGFGQMLGLMNLAGQSLGSLRKGIPGVGVLLEQLGTTAGKNKIGAALGLSQKDLGGNIEQQIGAILKATKGQRAGLEKAFGGEQLKVLLDLGKTYATGFEGAKGSIKEKTAAGVAALESAFTSAGKSTVAWKDIQDEASEEMTKAPQKIATATEKLRQAFQSEQMQAAIGKVADKLPALADFLAKVATWTVDNPGAAITAAIVGSIGKAAIGDAVGSLIKSAGSGAGIAGGILALGVVALTAESVIFDAKDKARDKHEADAFAADNALTVAKGAAARGGFASSEDQKMVADTTADLEKRIEAAQKSKEVSFGGEGYENNYVMAAKNFVTGGPNLAALQARDKDVEDLPQLQEQLQALKDYQAQYGGAGKSGGVPTGPMASMMAPPGMSAPAAAPQRAGVDPATMAALNGQAAGRATADAIGGKVLQVRIVGGVGPTGGGAVTPGTAPR